MSADVSAVIEPLVARKIFSSEKEAVQELVKAYILQQIAALQQEVDQYGRKYGMRFERFGEYLHERSVLLETGQLSPQQRQTLGQAIMQEEDDWLDWKVAKEMLESWLGLREEVTA